VKVLVAGGMTHLPGHLASGSARAFEELGHEVEIHDYLGFRDHPLWKLGNRARLRARGLQRLLYPSKRAALLRSVRRFGPDLLFVISGEVFDPKTIARVRSWGVRTVLWTGDDPYQRGRELVAAPAYDRVYVFDPWYIPALRANGVRRPAYLPMAVDPALYRPLALDEGERAALQGDVCFVGTWYPNRDELLRRLRDFRVQIWGGGWPLAIARPGHPLRSSYRGRAFGEDVVRIYCAHRAVINIQHPQSKDGQNMRAFEAPACGSLTFTPMTAELPTLFRPGEEIVAYDDLESLRGKLRYYLDHPDDARRVASAGMRRARGEHTYRDRIGRVLEEIP
jgi:spore maturation protein CgeB